jgi:hypothetical protein
MCITHRKTKQEKERKGDMPDPGSRIPDPGSRIPDPESIQKFTLNENCNERLSTIVEVMRPAVGESKF